MAIFPASDTFAEGATHYGQRLVSYIRHRPWVTSGDAVTGHTITNGIGDLHSGYSGSFNIAAFKTQGGSGATSDLGAVLWRQAYLANARTTLTFRSILSASAAADDIRFYGVCARVSGGAYVDTTGSQSIRDTTGYWLMLSCDKSLASGLRYRWFLLRVNAGVLTVLNQIEASVAILNSATGAHQMLLEVTTSGGNPVLTTLYDGVEIMPPYTDSSVSKIVASGRCGFGIGRDRQLTVPTRTIVGTASRFTIFDLDAGSTLLADDFSRVNTTANATVTDGSSVTGRLLSSMWTLDIHGVNAFAGGGTQYRDAGLNRVESRGGTYNFSQIGAADQVIQGRSVVFRKTANVAYTTATGIFLRAVMKDTADPHNGYLFTINYSNATYTAIMRRFNAGVPVTLATADVSTGYGLSTSADFTLLASIQNVSTIPQLLMTINGIGVSGWTLYVTGVTVIGTLVRDASSGFITSGPAQAIQITPFASTADGSIFYRSWTDEAIPDTGGPGDEENEPSIVIGSETDGKVGTHSMPIGAKFEVEDRARVEAQPYESMHVARIVFDAHTRRLWRITVEGASQPEKDDLLDFWAGHGKSTPFDFVDPESPTNETIPAHFLDDSLSTVRTGPLTSSFSYVVEELFENETVHAFVPRQVALHLTTYAPMLNVATPGTAALHTRPLDPLVAIKFTPGVRSLVTTTFAPTRPP